MALLYMRVFFMVSSFVCVQDGIPDLGGRWCLSVGAGMFFVCGCAHPCPRI